MRCVYSKNKSVSTKVEEDSTLPSSQISVKRTSLIVTPIMVFSRNSGRSSINKKQLSHQNAPNPNKLTMTLPVRLMTTLGDQETVFNDCEKLIQKPSLINILYDDDQQLMNQRISNQMKYMINIKQQTKLPFNQYNTSKSFQSQIDFNKKLDDIINQKEKEDTSCPQLVNTKKLHKLRVTKKIQKQ